MGLFGRGRCHLWNQTVGRAEALAPAHAVVREPGDSKAEM